MNGCMRPETAAKDGNLKINTDEKPAVAGFSLYVPSLVLKFRIAP